MLDSTPLYSGWRLPPKVPAYRFALHAPPGSRNDLPLDEIVAYIRGNVARRITLEDIAGVARLSVFQLMRAFRRESTLTPYGLVLELRIEHAKSLLARGKSIADAAYGAGFSDQSHLTRHFRRRTGVTPKAYRAVARAAS